MMMMNSEKNHHRVKEEKEINFKNNVVTTKIQFYLFLINISDLEEKGKRAANKAAMITTGKTAVKAVKAVAKSSLKKTGGVAK